MKTNDLFNFLYEVISYFPREKDLERLLKYFLYLLLMASFLMAVLPFAPFERRMVLGGCHFIFWLLLVGCKYKHYKTTGFTLIIVLSTPPILLTYLGLPPENALRWLAVSILAGGLLLSIKYIIAVFIAQMFLAISLPVFQSELSLAAVFEPFIFLNVIFGLVVIWSCVKRKETLQRDKTDLALSNLQKNLENEVHNQTRQLTESNRRLNQEIIERKKAEQTLIRSEKKYRKMMEAMVDGIYICSRDYEIEYMNPTMIKRLGYDATGKRCYKSVHGLNQPCQWCVFNKMKEDEPIEFNITSPLDDHTYRVMNLPIKNEDGTISKMTILRDITKYLEVVSEKEKAQKLLTQAQKMESIGTLAGGIAHDFNNILVSIIGYAEIALHTDPEEVISKDDIKQILTAGNRAKELVKQILRDTEILISTEV